MENNNRSIKKLNGLKLREIDNLHPIDKFHFIEFMDKDNNLNVAFALYVFKGVYCAVSSKKFFKPEKVTMCKKLTEYIKTDKEFISIQMAEYYKVQYAEEFILSTQWYKMMLENFNIENNVENK